ncbi:MAG: hypothetical protein CL912_33830 [Deltaproteobacteria bacterium]|nr:hypothetical protein [Deltaproteobacteria bacterium]
MLENNLPESFSSTDAENPFVYAAHQRSWEGPGSRPGQYIVPQGIYVPRHKKPASEAAPELVPDVVRTSEESATSTSQRSTSDVPALFGEGSESSFKGAQTSVNILSICPHTPANKIEHPDFRCEHVGDAFMARPVNIGSPPENNHLRGRGSDMTESRSMGTEYCDINPEDDDFDLPEDTQKRSVKQFSLVNLSLIKTKIANR